MHLSVSDDTMIEWINHASQYALNWLTTMTSDQRVSVVVLNFTEERVHLRQNILHTAQNPNEEAAIHKDLILIDAAVGSDRRVVSADETIRRLFARATKFVGHIEDIMWANPMQPADNTHHWIRSGAPAESALTLLEFRVAQLGA